MYAGMCICGGVDNRFVKYMYMYAVVYHMAGKFCGVLIFVTFMVDSAVTKSTIHKINVILTQVQRLTVGHGQNMGECTLLPVCLVIAAVVQLAMSLIL